MSNVRIPSDFNDQLELYQEHLRNEGVIMSKSEMIIRLAQIGYKHECQALIDLQQDTENYN